jgi:hypothetical protein
MDTREERGPEARQRRPSGARRGAELRRQREDRGHGPSIGTALRHRPADHVSRQSPKTLGEQGDRGAWQVRAADRRASHGPRPMIARSPATSSCAMIQREVLMPNSAPSRYF